MPASHNLPPPKRFNRRLINIFGTHKAKVKSSLAPIIAADFVSELKKRIQAQSFKGWAPLNVEYKQYKKAKGFDTRTLIKTGEYLNSIGWRRTPAGNISVGSRKRVHSASGLPMMKLARIHEYGSAKAGIPPRPHWGPTIAYIRRKYGI